MKKILFITSLLVCGTAVFLFSQNTYAAKCSVTVDGIMMEYDDPQACIDARNRENARLAAQEKAKQKETENPIVRNSGQAQWSAGDQSGTYNVDETKVKEDWANKTSAGIKMGGMQMAGAVNQAASTMVKDPYAAGITTGVVSTAAGAMDFSAAGQYNKLSDQYAMALAENKKARALNNAEIAKIDTQLKTLKPTPENKAKIGALTAAREQIQTEVTKQSALISEQRSGYWSNKMANYAGKLGGAAMVYMGVQNYEQGRRMAADQKYCKEHPKDVQCGGTGIPNEGLPKDCTKPENKSLPECGGEITTTTPTPLPQGWAPDSGQDPFGTTPGGGPGSGGAVANTGGPGRGSRGGGDPSFLGGGGMGGGSSGGPSNGANPEADFGGGYSGDQAYASQGGDGSSSGSEPLMSIDFGRAGATEMPADGFDISKFFPGATQEEESEGRMIALSPPGQPLEQKNKLLGDKDSPSLFTRITKAHQKKAHELVQEVLF